MNPKIQAEINKAAKEYCGDWPTEVYGPNDLALFYERGAEFGFAIATKMHEECVKGLVEALEQIEFHENPNPHKQEKTLYYRLANEALAAYREAMETGGE